MASWEPNQDDVGKICELLHEVLQQRGDQQAIFMQLEERNQHPEFNNYLTYVLTCAHVSLVMSAQLEAFLACDDVSVLWNHCHLSPAISPS